MTLNSSILFPSIRCWFGRLKRKKSKKAASFIPDTFKREAQEGTVAIGTGNSTITARRSNSR